MEQIEFDVELTAKELYAFSMRHTYTSFSGIFGVVISLASWIWCGTHFAVLDTPARAALLLIGCLFTIVQPLMLYYKARAQVRTNKSINASLNYIIGKEGITVTQGEQEVTIAWKDIRKKVVLSGAVYLYTSPVRAFIFPKEQCGGNFAALCDRIAEYVK